MVQPVSGSRQVLEAAMQAELPSCASSVSFPSIFFHQPSPFPFVSHPSSLCAARENRRRAKLPSCFSVYFPPLQSRTFRPLPSPTQNKAIPLTSRCLHTISPFRLILDAVTQGTAEKTYSSVWLVLQLGDQDVWLGNESDPPRSHSPAASASSASRFPSSLFAHRIRTS